MLLNMAGEFITINGRTFTIGDTIQVEDDVYLYYGLYGTISEIRDGDDKQTENTGIDIICKLDPPIDETKARDIEIRFSEIHHEHKPIEDIILDRVVMGINDIKTQAEWESTIEHKIDDSQRSPALDKNVHYIKIQNVKSRCSDDIMILTDKSNKSQFFCTSKQELVDKIIEIYNFDNEVTFGEFIRSIKIANISVADVIEVYAEAASRIDGTITMSVTNVTEDEDEFVQDLAAQIYEGDVINLRTGKTL